MPAINRAALSLLLIATATPAVTSAASIATDNASEAIYLDGNGWANGDNGGTGFGPWSLNPSFNNGNSGFFNFTSTQNGNGDSNGDGDIDSAGSEAWGLYANSGATASAYRPFTGALAVGQTFSVDMDNGFIDNGNRVGFALTNAAGQSRFEFYFRGGRSFYTYTDWLGSELSIITPFTDEGLRLTFTVLPNDNYTATVTPRDTNILGLTWFGPLAGTSLSGITGIRLFNENAGFNSPANAYFNNLSIGPVPVPLPAAVLGAVPLLGLLACGRVRRKG